MMDANRQKTTLASANERTASTSVASPFPMAEIIGIPNKPFDIPSDAATTTWAKAYAPKLVAESACCRRTDTSKFDPAKRTGPIIALAALLLIFIDAVLGANWS
ncbi:hypothetical protein SMG44B_20182 [Stenotrophomonas maltophilia]